MKRNLLHQILFSLTQVGVLVLALACSPIQAHAGDVLELPAVGPRPAGEYAKVACGYLTVYSRTQQTQWGEGSYYYPHSSYRILDASGKTIKQVENHDNIADETPTKVELAPGTYTVRAWSDRDGLVSVPVVIKLARTTDVRLDDGRVSEIQTGNPTKVIKTPSGQVVGWKA